MAALLEVSGWRAKLGEVPVKIAGMENPPKQFLAGSDALTMVTPVLEARLVVPWKLTRSSPGSEPVIIGGAGHDARDPGVADSVVAATDRFAATR